MKKTALINGAVIEKINDTGPARCTSWEVQVDFYLASGRFIDNKINTPENYSFTKFFSSSSSDTPLGVRYFLSRPEITAKPSTLSKEGKDGPWINL
jgi:hypothetical protein